MTSALTGGNKVLRITHPDLPSLASQAAVELDIIAHGQSTPLVAVKRLGTLIGNSFAQAAKNPDQHGAVDAATLAVIGEAFARNKSQHKTIAEITAEAVKIANSLVAENPNSNPGNLEWMRAFCVSLSRCAAAYRKSIHDLRPRHPFKK